MNLLAAVKRLNFAVIQNKIYIGEAVFKLIRKKQQTFLSFLIQHFCNKYIMKGGCSYKPLIQDTSKRQSLSSSKTPIQGVERQGYRNREDGQIKKHVYHLDMGDAHNFNENSKTCPAYSLTKATQFRKFVVRLWSRNFEKKKTIFLDTKYWLIRVPS